MSGHTTGKFSKHRTVSGCPIYHNMTLEECKARAEMRADKAKLKAEEGVEDQDPSAKNLRQSVSEGRSILTNRKKTL